MQRKSPKKLVLQGAKLTEWSSFYENMTFAEFSKFHGDQKRFSNVTTRSTNVRKTSNGKYHNAFVAFGGAEKWYYPGLLRNL